MQFLTGIHLSHLSSMFHCLSNQVISYIIYIYICVCVCFVFIYLPLCTYIYIYIYLCLKSSLEIKRSNLSKFWRIGELNSAWGKDLLSIWPPEQIGNDLVAPRLSSVQWPRLVAKVSCIYIDDHVNHVHVLFGPWHDFFVRLLSLATIAACPRPCGGQHAGGHRHGQQRFAPLQRELGVLHADGARILALGTSRE